MKALPPEVERFCRAYYGALGTPIACELLQLMSERNWDAIAVKRIDPRAYTCAVQYFKDASAASLLRKCEDLPTSFDRKAAAVRNWKKGEESCFRTNRRLFPYLEGLTNPSSNMDVARHIVGIRKIVASILGRVPSQDDLIGRHGPGATFSDPAIRSTIADKMNSIPSATPGCLHFLPNWLETKWGRECASAGTPRSPVFVRGNRFSTAPKDAEKDRPIGAEPSLNVFYQLSLGKLIRRRLKNVGIDLDDGQDKHRQVACAASITGRHATLDLSNASDTVSAVCVELLMPNPWFELLNWLRSPYTRVDGKWVRLEKFSSMGNGFTFELESLIFYAIVRYTEMMLLDDDVEDDTLVYGDDIICRTEIVTPVTKILNFFGFQLNEEKSFWAGPFRESCGGDYFSGQAVRPYFMKEFPCEPQHFIAAANAIRKKAFDCLGSLDVLLRAWFILLDNIPTGIRRCRGPEGLGDVVIHDDEERWVTRWRSQTKYIAVYRPARYRKVPFKVFDDGVVHACALYGVPWSGGFVIPRDAVLGYKVGWIVAWGVNDPEYSRTIPLEKVLWG